MKIPKTRRQINTEPIFSLWRETARKMSLEYGIYIDIGFRYLGDVIEGAEEIYFEVGEHKFGSLRDLRKALRNKSFL
jgi:hypothetical protein